MKIKIKHKSVSGIILKVLLLVLLITDLYPFIWMLLGSFKTNVEFASSMFALPKGLHFENYITAYQLADIATLFKNTVFVTFISITIIWFLSANLAFAIVKMRWRLSEAVLRYIQLGMFIPSFVLLLPQFLLFQKMQLLNSLWSLVLVFSTNISMSVYILTGFYRAIPDEILEAAVIDGCSLYKAFWRIAVPISINGYITIIMLSFVNIWNDLLISQTFVSSTKKRLLQVGLAAFLDAKGAREWGPTFAAIVLSIFPTMIIYLILNKKVISGLTVGSIKG